VTIEIDVRRDFNVNFLQFSVCGCAVHRLAVTPVHTRAINVLNPSGHFTCHQV